MASIATITVTDDSGATNNRDFDPVSTSGGVASWENKDSSTTAGRPSLMLSVDKRKPNRATDRIKLSLAYPKEVLQDGEYVITDTFRATIEVVSPSGFTDDDREDCAYILANLLDSTAVFNAIKDIEAVY